jgi:nicotinamidase/pyrazinamidase
MDALIAVDVQNDFLPGGALAVPAGDEVIPVLERLAAEAPLVIATRDWHPPDDPSFAAQGGEWPVHCVQGTPGAQLDPRIEALAETVVDKPTNDATVRTKLVTLLRDRGVKDIWVGGLAFEFCVLETALGLRQSGFEVSVVEDATRRITDEGAGAAKADMQNAGIKIVHAGEGGDG